MLATIDHGFARDAGVTTDCYLISAIDKDAPSDNSADANFNITRVIDPDTGVEGGVRPQLNSHTSPDKVTESVTGDVGRDI